MNKAEEIAANCAVKEEWFYGPLLKSINEALEWAAQRCEAHTARDNAKRDISPMDMAAFLAAEIRLGKSA